jgi:predicted lipoprotein with Yx(FWY)xxD motif
MKTNLAQVLLVIAAPLTMAFAAPVVAPVTKVNVNGHDILADRNGMTAYVFDEDKTADSVCYGGCAKNWPPILLQASEQVTAPFSVSVRKDNARQINFNGHPIYRFAGDFKSGETKGDGLANTWHVIPQ